MKDYPKHLAGSLREWKQQKRQEVKALDNSKELADLLCGCAYTPAYDEIYRARELIRVARKKLSVRNWGR